MSTPPFGFLHGGAVLSLVVMAFSVGGSARSFGRCNPGALLVLSMILVRVFRSIKQRKYE
jgi:hypothetical protein